MIWIRNTFDFFVKSKFFIFPWNGSNNSINFFLLITILSLPNFVHNTHKAILNCYKTSYTLSTFNTFWTYFGTWIHELKYENCTVMYVVRSSFYVGVNYNLTNYPCVSTFNIITKTFLHKISLVWNSSFTLHYLHLVYG